MKFLKKWYNRYTSNKMEETTQTTNFEVDGLLSTEPEHGSSARLEYLQNNFEYYRKYGKEKLARMIQILRNQLEAQSDELTTARIRGSILSYRTMMAYYERMESEIENIETRGKNIENTTININNFDK